MVDCLRGGGCRLADTIVSAIPDLDHLGSLDLILHGFFSKRLAAVSSCSSEVHDPAHKM